MRTAVPFEFASPLQPLIVVPATVDDEGPYRFVLDTGAGHTLLVPHVAQRLGLERGGTREGVGAGGKVRIELSRVASLAVGDAHATNLEVGITEELSALSAIVGSPLDGNLGHNFLKDFRVTVDYSGRILHMADPDEEDHAARRGWNATVPFRLAAPAKPLVLVDAFVNRRGPFPFVVDTGASTTVLGSAVARQLGIATQPAPALTGGGGAVHASIALLHVLRVGQVSVPSLRVAVAEFLSLLSDQVGARLEGIVGYNFLKEFRVTIDYARSVLRLE